MKKLFLFFILSFATFAQSNGPSMVHLLTYLSQDYPDAVKHGKIQSQDEYNEQIEFINEVISLAAKEVLLPKDVINSLNHLKKLIDLKSNHLLVSKLAIDIKLRIIDIFQIPTYPSSWPSLENGKKVYQNNCISCHGTQGAGDGPDSEGLEPKPRNFHDKVRMEFISPFQAFNTISLGIEGTSMVAYKDLSESDRWDLSFYILSLRYLESEKSKNNFFNLIDTSSKSDFELKEKLSEFKEEEKISQIAYLRTLDREKKEDISFFIEKANSYLNNSLEAYEKKDFEKSLKLSFSAYLEGVEPFEKFIKGTPLLNEIENSMGNIREGIKERISLGELTLRVGKAKKDISKVQKKLDGSTLMPFWLSFGVVFREAMESLLLIISIVTIVRKANFQSAEKWIHGGWIFSIFVGVIGYIILDKTISVSGAQIEKVEGITSLLAAAILLYVGVWFQRKSSMKKWVELINQKVSNSMGGGSLFGLAFISFLVVFREVFETMLFVKVLLMEYDSLALVLLGIVFAILATLFIGFAFLRFSSRIPLKHIFTVSSLLILLLVLMLINKGIGAFQSVGILPATKILVFTAEALVLQAFVLFSGIYILFFQKKN